MRVPGVALLVRLMLIILVSRAGVAAADVPKPPGPPPAPADAPSPAPSAPGDAPAPSPTAPTDAPPLPPATAPTSPAKPPAPGPSPAAPTETPTPPAATGPTFVVGRVTDVLARPVTGARVYVLPRRAKPIQTSTDKDGRYRVEVRGPGTYGVVIAIDKAHTFRTVLVRSGATNTMDVELELDTEGGEVIRIEDRKRPEPKVKAKPRKDVRMSLPYSDEAVERDAWARAWLLLDVDEAGRVTRLKLLKRPGFDLDRICIEEALKLQFEPARDAQGRPMKTYMLWTMEWPSWGWLIQGNGVAVRRPADTNDLHAHAQNIRAGVTGTDLVLGSRQPIGGPWSRPLPNGTAFEGALDRVPCAGSGPLNLDLRNRAYRDCSQPDLAVIDSLPWITPETAPTAIAELANPDLMLVADTTPPGSPIPGYVGAGVTAALAIATVYGFYQYDKYQSRVEDAPWQALTDPEQYADDGRRRTRWGKITLGLSTATILSAGVTLLVWNRNQSKRSFSVQPSSSGDGGAAVFTTSW